MEWLEAGYIGLFIATFLAATILPFSSEAMLMATLMADFDPSICLFIATGGNTLGGMSSYYLGYLGDWEKIAKWLRTKADKIIRWERLIKRYGAFTALLCWLPFVGDAIAIALGIFRVNRWWVLLYMTIGKGIRYFLIIWFWL